jgi:hypothetical protein
MGGRLIADDFYYGRPWEIGLKRFAPEISRDGLALQFLPLRADAPVYLSPKGRPDFQGCDAMLEVQGIMAEAVYEVAVNP